MAQSRIQSPLLWVLGILLSTLPLLAWLQWRWIGEITTRESERLKQNVRTSATYAAWSFNQRLLALEQSFNLRSAEKIADYEPKVLAMWQDWRQSPDSSIVEKIFLLRAMPDEFGLNSEYDLYEFSFQSRRFDIADISAPAHSVVASIANLAYQPPIVRISSGLRALVIPLIPEGFFQKALFSQSGFEDPKKIGDSALSKELIPAMEERMMMEGGIIGQQLDILVVLLDSNHIRNRILPHIIKAHLKKTGFGWAVLDRINSEVLCTSDSSLDVSSFAKPDFTAPIGFVPPRAPNLVGKALTSVFLRLPLVLASEQDFQQQVGLEALSTSLPEAVRASGVDSTFAANLLGSAELRVLASAGTVQQDVERFRAKNLVVSFGVLLVLTVGLVVVFLAVLRSERLSEQQMRFVAGVSHELRTPLAVLQSASENMSDGIVKTPEQIRKYGLVMKREIARLIEMTEQTLNFAGIQSGRQRIDRQEISIEALLQSFSERNHDILQSEEFSMQTRIQPHLPIILGDAKALGSALDNLLGNAIKYSRQERLEVSIYAALEGQYITLAMEDFGQGIAPKDLKRIFEPFFRTNEAVNAQIQGNGLGLAIVDYIVKHHGGFVSVKSKLGEGSVFTLHLPIKKK